MGFVLGILYLLTCYLTPPVIFGPLAEFRVELILAGLLALVSVPLMGRSIITKTAQSLALVGLAIATFLSVAIGAHWVGGGFVAVLDFVPSLFAYFIVCVHCTSKRKVQWIVIMLLFVCLFVVGQGALEMQKGLPTDPLNNGDVDNSYFFGMLNEQQQWFYRLRGMGQIHDPNDFAQLIVCTLPLTFIFWKKKSFMRNVFFVLLPVAGLLWGAYLTHSRGSMLALTAILIVALRPRIGTVPSLMLAGALFVGASALHFTGGRDISASAGEDRTDLWGQGLELLKEHPLFGVGLGSMPEYVGKTAHNTIVVCAAELGALGLFFWSMFLQPSLRDVMVISSPKVLEGKAPEPEKARPPKPPPPTPVPQKFMPNPMLAAAQANVPDQDDVRRLGRLLVLSFTGFLVSGWFLSRAYVLTLFLLGGLTEVAFQMAIQSGMPVARLPLTRVLRYSAMLMVGFIAAMYLLLRVVNLTH